MKKLFLSFKKFTKIGKILSQKPFDKNFHRSSMKDFMRHCNLQSDSWNKRNWLNSFCVGGSLWIKREQGIGEAGNWLAFFFTNWITVRQVMHGNFLIMQVCNLFCKLLCRRIIVPVILHISLRGNKGLEQ